MALAFFFMPIMQRKTFNFIIGGIKMNELEEKDLQDFDDAVDDIVEDETKSLKEKQQEIWNRILGLIQP